MTLPPTYGTTALLTRWGIGAVLGLSVGFSGLLSWLVVAVDPANLPAALEALAALSGPAFLALGATAGGGTVVHGARHIGGAPAPTSAELRASAVEPAPAGDDER